MYIFNGSRFTWLVSCHVEPREQKLFPWKWTWVTMQLIYTATLGPQLKKNQEEKYPLVDVKSTITMGFICLPCVGLYNLNCSCMRHSHTLQKHMLCLGQKIQRLNASCSMHELSWGSLCEKAVTEESNSQEDEGVDVDHVPPQRLLRGVCELPLQLGLFFWRQFDRLVLFQPAEAHYQPFAQTWWIWGFCEGRGKCDEANVLVPV